MSIASLVGEFGARGLSLDDLTRILNSQRSKGFTQEAFPTFLDTVRRYTSGGGDYSLVNSVLRGSYTPDRPEELASARKLIDILDDIMSQSPKLEEDVVTFRGIAGGPSADTLVRMRPGQSFTDRGFGSTSMSQNIARNFAGLDREWDNPGLVMRIVNPSGSSGLFPFAFRRPHELTGAYDELEYIVPRSSMYDVVDIGDRFLDVIRRLPR